MADLKLTVLSLRYSSWSMRPWLALTHAGADFETETVELESFETTTLAERRALGSVAGLFPVLRIDGAPVHESLAICEYAAETFPKAGLWPGDTIARARARAICCEMVGGFLPMRSEMSCHLFARVPGFVPSDAARRNIDRIFEIWSECLDRSGGPFLFGPATIADFFYFPVLARFRTYGIGLPQDITDYAQALEAQSAVVALLKKARAAPATAVYDEYVIGLGGNPAAV
jgi:glutathione S-transferase